jgi:hypothetical protein
MVWPESTINPVSDFLRSWGIQTGCVGLASPRGSPTKLLAGLYDLSRATRHTLVQDGRCISTIEAMG